MDDNTVRTRISTYFPELKIEKLKKFGEGTGNIAYEVNSDLIFRFPKGLESQKQLEREIVVQGLLKKYGSLPTPEFTFLPKDHSFVGYKKLVGTPMLYLRNNFTSWDYFSEQIGSFLRTLHDIPKEKLRSLNSMKDTRSCEDWKKRGQAFYEKTKHLIPEKYSTSIEAFFDSELPKGTKEVVLCHNDLGIEHILLTDDKITGIIDWGGVALTDPANDFARVYRDLGEEVLGNVLSKYSPEQEKGELRERAIFYGKYLLFEDLSYGIEHNEYMEKALAALEWMFNNSFKIKIAPLHPADWKDYKTIQLEALKADPQAFGASYNEWIDFSDEKWQERPSNKDSLIFVARDGGTPIGLVGVHIEYDNNEKVAHIWGMYVRSMYRGMGLGKQLLTKAIDEIRNVSEIKKIQLMVEYEPTPAQLLYTSLGFQTSGTTNYTLGDGKKHKLYIMEKLLL